MHGSVARLGQSLHALVQIRGALIGVSTLSVIVVCALLADQLAPHSPTEQFRDAVRLPPAWDQNGQWRFLLGTDALGRDVLSRLLHGARISLLIGTLVMLASVFIGSLLGLSAAFVGGWLDTAITRTMDVLLAIPGLVLAILIVAVIGPGLVGTIVAVSIIDLPNAVRLMRGAALAELPKDYTIAARVSGVRPLRLALRTLLPNCVSPMIVQAALCLSNAILAAAALGFLGLGAQPPTPEWGSMLADSREFIRSDPWLVTLPGLAILTTVIAINLVGDALRDVLDPTMRT
jgi:dipeptide transport system permease protein